MAEGRRLTDALTKFLQARSELIRTMSVGAPLAGPEASRQLARLRDLHELVQITQAAVQDAEDHEPERRSGLGDER
jgi:hypothetical protein